MLFFDNFFHRIHSFKNCHYINLELFIGLITWLNGGGSLLSVCGYASQNSGHSWTLLLEEKLRRLFEIKSETTDFTFFFSFLKATTKSQRHGVNVIGDYSTAASHASLKNSQNIKAAWLSSGLWCPLHDSHQPERQQCHCAFP